MAHALSALILAAGKGVRMKSALPKVLHPILGKPMIRFVVEKVRQIGATDVTAIVGFGKDALIEAIRDMDLRFVEQTEQLGTGHAVQCYAKVTPRPPDHLLVVCGDTPLLSAATLKELKDRHFSSQNHLTMMTLVMADPGGYGRILRDAAGTVKAIRENKDCTPEEKLVKETNLAVYIFDGPKLFETLPLLRNDNKQKEYYLTDLVELFAGKGWKIETVREQDEQSTLGINSRNDLANVGEILQKQVLDHHMTAGVTIVAPGQTFISADARIGPDTVIWPGTVITGSTVIGAQCEIGPNALLADATLGDRVRIRAAIAEHAVIADGTIVPPFTRLGRI